MIYMAKWLQIGLSDPGTRVIIRLIRLHDFALLIGVVVMVFVGVGLVSVITSQMRCRRIYAAHEVEMIWTVVPGIILFTLAFPSIRLLYAMDEVFDPLLTVKVVGHQ
jgi:cytochrome c oxidase subunit 2